MWVTKIIQEVASKASKNYLNVSSSHVKYSRGLLTYYMHISKILKEFDNFESFHALPSKLRGSF